MPKSLGLRPVGFVVVVGVVVDIATMLARLAANQTLGKDVSDLRLLTKYGCSYKARR